VPEENAGVVHGETSFALIRLGPTTDDVAVTGDGVVGHCGGAAKMLTYEAVGEVTDGSEGGQEDYTSEMEVEEGWVLDTGSGACDAVGSPMQNVEAVAGRVSPAEIGWFCR